MLTSTRLLFLSLNKLDQVWTLAWWFLEQEQETPKSWLGRLSLAVFRVLTSARCLPGGRLPV